MEIDGKMDTENRKMLGWLQRMESGGKGSHDRCDDEPPATDGVNARKEDRERTL